MKIMKKEKKGESRFLKNKKEECKFLKNKKEECKFLQNKKAQGHVEMILSFVLFVGALVVLFLFINPFAETKEISVIEGIQEKIINEISLDIGKLGIIIHTDGTCYNFTAGDYVGDYKEIDEGNRKYNIYFNNIFSNSAPNKNDACAPLNYTLGIYSSERIIVYENIESFVASYNSDYRGLKDSLGIISDFTFGFSNLVHEEIQELSVSKEAPVGVDVEAKEFPVRVINNNAEIQELILNIKAWA